jgi:glycine cleavage system H protein
MVALLVIGMILICFAVDYFVRRKEQKVIAVEKPKPAFGPSLAIPGGYYLSPAHTWVQTQYSGRVRVGIDEFVSNLIGSAEMIEVIPLNTEVKKGEPLFTVGQGDRKLTFRSPVTGKVTVINETITNSKDKLSSDPYLGGWILSIEPKNLSTELKVLAIADEATRWLKNELGRFRDFVMSLKPQGNVAFANATLLDGGIPAKGILQQMDAKSWELFEKQFLSFK